MTPQQPAAATGQLAPGWTEHTAPDGRKYYYNKATGKSLWDKPLAQPQGGAPSATPVPKVGLVTLDSWKSLLSL